MRKFEGLKAKSNDVPRVTVGNLKLKLLLSSFCRYW